VTPEQPQIQYATASDGVRLAYWSVGEGAPVLHLSPIPVSNIQKEWGFPPQRKFYEALVSSLQLVRYDCRGSGLSDREVSDYSLEAHERDIFAIADRLGLERFALLGYGHSGGVAIDFAARHPERVTHLVLWCCYPRGADYGRVQRVQTFEKLMDQDWDFWTRAESLRLSEYEGGETSNYFLEYVRDSLTKEGSRAAVAEMRKIDVTELMAEVQAPTLVLHRSGLAAITVEMAREMATTIPNARLMLFDGSGVAPFLGGGKEIAAAIRAFVLEKPVAPPMTQPDVGPSVLTPREIEVLRLIAAGRTSSEISAELSLSVRTVGRHITNIYGKIGARTRADATAWAIRHRIAV
jgi:pimeloyl-ACP methyl ester carboxylesterase/DNA-binding CsgD family transcriptional regulator